MLFKYIKISFTTFYFSTFRRREIFIFYKIFRKNRPVLDFFGILNAGILRTEDITVTLKSIPSNFIAAFVKEEKFSGTICINVHVDNAADVFDFVIPEYMSHHGFLTTAAAFDMLPGKKAVEILNEAYIFAISTTSRSITAFKVYKKTKDEKIKKAIQKNYLLTALSIIAFATEDDFMDFLKLVEVKYNKRILNGLQKKGWLPSISYILQNTKETEKEDFALS